MWTSISIASNGSWVELEPLRTKPEANITLVLSTTELNGILLYNGESQHIAVELFLGRIRISYDVGNYPASTMYRYGERIKKINAFIIPSSTRVKVTTGRVILDANLSAYAAASNFGMNAHFFLCRLQL